MDSIRTLDAGILDEFQVYIIGKLATFMGLLGPYHQFMYATFIFIVVCLLACKMTRRIDMSWTLLTKLITISIFVWMTKNWGEITGLWAETMVWAGTNAGGNHLAVDRAFSASRIWAAGMQVSGGIIDAAFSLKIIYKTGGVFIAWIYCLCAILTLAAFGFMAIQVFIATTLFQVIVMVGMFLLPFGIWKLTAFIAEPVFGVIASYGVSMMVLTALMNLVVGFGDVIIPRLSEFTFAAAASAALFSLAAMFLGIYGRKIATEMITGSASIGAEEALNALSSATRTLAATVGGIALAGAGAVAIGTKAAQAATGAAAGGSSAGASGVSSGSAGVGTNMLSGSGSGNAGAGTTGASGPSSVTMKPIQAAEAMASRFEGNMGDVGKKAAEAEHLGLGSEEAEALRAAGYKRVAEEMVSSAGKEGGLSHAAADKLSSDMASINAQHRQEQSQGIGKAQRFANTADRYQSAISEAVGTLKANGDVSTGNARESVGFHTLSADTGRSDVMMANRLGVVADIHKHAAEGKSVRESMEALDKDGKLKPVEEAAVLNGAADEANVHKMGMIKSVREALGVPTDKKEFAAWQADQAREKEKSSPVVVQPVQQGSAAIVLNPTNNNTPSVPQWLKRSAGGRIMPTGTSGNGGFRVSNVSGDN